MEHSEILILGGSLAGMACAIELNKLGHSACVLEKTVFPRPKLCGEFLGPDALRALSVLGLLESVRDAAFGPVEQTLFYNRQGREIKIRHAWMDRQFPYAVALPRERLDMLLADYARMLGVRFLEGHRVLSPIRELTAGKNCQPEFYVHAQTMGQPDESQFCCRFLVNATGRSGKLGFSPEKPQARFAPETAVYKRRVGVQCHVRLPEKSEKPDLHMYLFPGGYGGFQPISDRLANVCMLVDAPLSKLMHRPFADFISGTIGQNPAALERLRGTEIEGDFCTTGDVNLAGESAGYALAKQTRVLNVGDACVTVDPFTGSGMAHALETGIMAARAIHAAIRSGWSQERMIADYHQAYRRKFYYRLKWMSYLRPLLENARAQGWLWPVIPPFLPLLARGLR